MLRGAVVRAAVLAIVGVSALLPWGARTLAAQPSVASSAWTTPRRDAPDPTDDTRWRVDRCLMGLGYHSIGRFSVGAAGGLRRAFEPRSTCLYGAAHVGLGAVRGSLGSAVTLGRFGSAIGVSGGALRTFGRPGGDALPWRTYVGGAVHLWPLLGVHTELGHYTRLSRAGDAPQRLVTWGVGFGY